MALFWGGLVEHLIGFGVKCKHEHVYKREARGIELQKGARFGRVPIKSGETRGKLGIAWQFQV